MGVEFDPTDALMILNNLKEAGPRALAFLTIDFSAEAVSNANVKTGTLRSSIQAEQQDDTSWIVGTNLEYASFPHDGFDSFELNRSVNIGGNWVYIKTHPGYEGNPFFTDAGTTVEGNVEEYITMAVEDLS